MARVYKVTNLVNMKVYIGATTTTMDYRMSLHKHSALTLGSNSEFYKAIREYGWSNFAVSEIESCREKDLFDREEYWIKELNSMWPNGYNTASSHNKGSYQSRVVSEKKSLSQIERFKDKDQRLNHSKIMKEMFADPKLKEKHRQGLKNSWTPERREEYRQKALNNTNLLASRNDEAIIEACAKSVEVFDIELNEIKTYRSMSDASKSIGCSISAITQAIKRKNAVKNKLIFKYKYDEKTFDQIIKEIEERKSDSYLNLSLIRQGRIPHNIKKVLLINCETNEKIKFNTITEAAKFLNKQTTNVSHACRKKGRVVGGYFAEYME